MRIGIIGAGHNGLVAGFYLARQGHEVEIFESQSIVGGLCINDETLLNDCIVSPGATWYGMLNPKIVTDMSLKKHGLDVLTANPQMLLYFDGGKIIVHEADASHQNSTDFSKLIESVLPAYKASLFNHTTDELIASEKLLDSYGLHEPFLDILKRTKATEPEIVEALFTAYSTNYGDPHTIQSFANYLHAATAEIDGKSAWGFARGGMGTLTEAMRRSVETEGGTISLSCAVEKITKNNDGWVLKTSADEHRFDLVISSISIFQLQKLLENELTEQQKRQIDTLPHGAAAFTYHAKLSSLPPLQAMYDSQVSQDLRYKGIYGIPHTLPVMKEVYQEVQSGRIPTNPMLTFSFMDQADPSVVHGDHHLLNVYAQFAPYLENPSKDQLAKARDQAKQAVKNVLGTVFNNFDRSILEDAVLLPNDYETRYGAQFGQHEHVQMTVDQLFTKRMNYCVEHYKLLDEFYLCGADMHPGGLVTGAAGYNCAQKLIEDVGGEDL